MALQRRTKLGLLLTGGYLILLAVFVIRGWVEAKGMPLNNWGDFLSGAFAPLAFLWLVIGYFQQSDELRNNTQALRIQADQLRHQVQETKALVQEASAQARASADLARHQAALLAHEERKAIPRFSEIHLHRSNDFVRIELRNVGGTITQLRLTSGPSGLRSMGVDPIGMLATSKQATIDFTFTGQALDNFEFDLAYEDTNVIPRHSRFQVQNDRAFVIKHGEPL